jgi:NADPH-dependent 2,4-dienoyl-CoA reductase/sulfur reductase-like enzyme
MANILIIGGGFGGLVTAEKLAASIDPSHQITLLAPNQKFTFYPALVQLAFGEIEPEDMTFDLRERLDELDVRFVCGELIRLNTMRSAAEVAGEDFRGEIEYDYVVFAPGRRLATEKIGGFFEHAHHLLGTGAALKFGKRSIILPKEQLLSVFVRARVCPFRCAKRLSRWRENLKNKSAKGKLRSKPFFPNRSKRHSAARTCIKNWKRLLRVTK